MSRFTIAEQIQQHEVHVGRSCDFSYQEVLRAFMVQEWKIVRAHGGFTFWESTKGGFVKVNTRTLALSYSSPTGKKFGCLMPDLVKALCKVLAAHRAA